MNRNMIRLIPLLFMLLLSIALASGLFNSGKRPFSDSSLVGYDMVPFTVPTLGTADVPHFAPREWKNKVVVLNVFASWCKPCAVEHEVWMKLARERKVNLYGLAWKDSPENVSAWLNKHGNPYHLIGVDQNGDTTIPLALTGVPETFILGPTGNIFFHHQAPVTQELVDKVIVPMVEKITSGELQAIPRATDANPFPARPVAPTASTAQPATASPPASPANAR